MDMDIAILPKKGLKRYDYNVYMDMDKYSCSSCDNKEVTHGLVKGNWFMDIKDYLFVQNVQK